jgi:epoxyqueuosine reductase
VNSLERHIRDRALELGFTLVGFAPMRRLQERATFFNGWLEEGRAGGMDWLGRQPERRLDPRELDPRLRSVVSLAYPYAAPLAPRIDWRAELRGRIASYALGPDYHDVVLDRARILAQEMQTMRSGALTRTYVDTGPVFEREWAAQGRLGWFGRNTNLINRYQGSYFFLAEIFTDLEFAPTREPYRDHCGTCRRCLDLCPTQALSDGYLLDSRLCISYLTIEHRGPIPVELRPKLGNWIFGCDICQEVCPWNSDSLPEAADDALMPKLEQIMMLDNDGFRRRFGQSAIRRTKRRGLLRNAAIALGNSGNPAAIPILVSAIERDPEPIVRSHAVWALGRLAGRSDEPMAQRALVRALGDPDRGVHAEAEVQLATLTSA